MVYASGQKLVISITVSDNGLILVQIQILSPDPSASKSPHYLIPVQSDGGGVL